MTNDRHQEANHEARKEGGRQEKTNETGDDDLRE